MIPFVAQVETDATEDEPAVECCPVCEGVFEHVLGCPEQDRAR